MHCCGLPRLCYSIIDNSSLFSKHGNWSGQQYNQSKEYEKYNWTTPEVTGWPDDYNDLIVKHNVDLVLNGHVHQYERTWPVKSVNETYKR